jgi:alpha-galactosidase
MQWSLRTRASAYVISSLDDGSGVVLDHWGEQIGDPELIPSWSEPDRFVGYATTADAQPLEYASAGQRHIAFSELLIDRGDGYTGAAWRVLADEVHFRPSTGGDALVIPFLDETGELRLELSFRTSDRHDVVRRRARIVNNSSGRIELPRAFSAGWNLPLGQRVRVDYLAGAWSHEFQRKSIDLDWGTFSIGSRQAVTSLNFSPVVTVTALNNGDSFSRPRGYAYGVALDWSGSWRLQVECSVVQQHARVSVGVDDDTTTITLLPGEDFTTPDSLGVFSQEGPEGVSRAWHDFQRNELTRDLSARTRPIVYNSWMATTFDVNIEHQSRLAAIAAGLGVETFVLDDGWFVGRTSDHAGLGDWTPDPAKFPNGLGELANRVGDLGMRFGIWVEPECVNPDSDLFRAHPDWVYRAGSRPLETIRHQYVLDLGREDVVEWVEGALRNVLRSAQIGYLKWDMNRPVSDGGRVGDQHGRQWPVQHTRNYYRVMRMLRDEFPELVVEACASGGARIDNAVLAVADVVWTSDEVGARDRLTIQDGFLSAYPSWVMSSWVSDESGHRDRQAVSLGYRFAVSMAGVLGIGSDLLKWSVDERSTATRMVAAYKSIRSVVHHGDVRLHGRPTENLYTVEYHGPSEDPRIVLFVYDRDRDRHRDHDQARVFPATLESGVRYEVRDAYGALLGVPAVTAESARGLGVAVPFAWANDADVLVLVPAV